MASSAVCLLLDKNGESTADHANESRESIGVLASCMSAELIGILGVGVALLSVGVALGALILAGRRDTAQRLVDMVQAAGPGRGPA